MRLADFDYNLPQELIAQKPVFPRDKCRLMVVDRKSGRIKHRRFFDIVDYLRAGDILILNDSKVFKARLFGRLSLRGTQATKQSRASTGSPRSPDGSLAMTDAYVEIFLLRTVKDSIWEVLGNPGRKLKVGLRVYFSKKVWCDIIGKNDDKYIARFSILGDALMKWADKHGHVPVPPYIKNQISNIKYQKYYQTVYAKRLGSVAAPTAGFHFTPALLRRLKKIGAQTAFITLHVGYGTFKPIKTERVEEHKMEPEWVEIPKSTSEAIMQAEKEGRRVVAVGTTTVRALEGAYSKSKIKKDPPRSRLWRQQKSKLLPHSGEVNLFITPGFKFKIVDALITNFHLPKSTLLLLVSAFAGRDLIMKAYAEAIYRKYFFYSFGDAMLIL